MSLDLLAKLREEDLVTLLLLLTILHVEVVSLRMYLLVVTLLWYESYNWRESVKDYLLECLPNDGLSPRLAKALI
jgi:hypothetical protein